MRIYLTELMGGKKSPSYKEAWTAVKIMRRLCIGWSRVQFPAGTRYFSPLQNLQTSCVPTSLELNWYHGLFTQG